MRAESMSSLFITSMRAVPLRSEAKEGAEGVEEEEMGEEREADAEWQSQRPRRKGRRKAQTMARGADC